MAYGNIAARHRLGLSARAYNALFQWAKEHASGFGGRHEELTWDLLSGVTAQALLKQRGCGHAVLDEIAGAMKQAGLAMPDHAASQERPPSLARGSKVLLAGRSRPMVVVDYAAMGEDVLVRLRADDGAEAEAPAGAV
jgi:hypothetical protein